MRRLILLVFIGTFLMREITLSKVIHRDSSNLSWLFGSSRLNDNKEGTQTVCESEECKKMADTILGNMNRSINPCDDFYEYACGRWQEHNPIPETEDVWSVYDKLQAKIEQQIQEIVEAEPEKDDLNLVKLAKKWYKACMDTDAMEKQGIEPLVSTLSRLGGWPMIMEPDKWNEQKYSWQKVDDQYMRLTGRNSFHDVRVQKRDDPKVKIDTPHLPLGSYKLRSAIKSDSEENEEEDEGKRKSDEDPSNEDEQSDEEHEPGSEGEDDSKIDDDNNDDNDIDDDDDNDDDHDNGDDDDNDDDDDDDDDDGSGDNDDDDDDNDDNDDDDDDDDEGSGDNDDDDDDMNKPDKDVKKELGKKKSKIGRRRSKLLRYVVQRKNDTQIIKKHASHMTKRQRTKRSTSATIINSKRAQRFIRRQKSHDQKSERNHVRKVHGKRTKKILSNEVTAKPQINEEKEKEITILQWYADYISKVAHIIAKEIGTEISQERLDKDIQDMIQFQLKLIQIVPTNSIFDLEFDLEVTLAGFQEWYDKNNPKTAKSKINWVNKIKALFDEAYEPVNEDLNLDIISPSYIKNLLSLLDKTSNRTILNYIHWNFISRIIKTTTSEMTDLYNSWEKVIMGRAPRPRSTICKITEIKDILAYEFVRKYFPKEIARTASNMLRDIQKEVEYLIKQSDWLDNKAKDFALAKVKNLKGLIGYPNWYKNTTIIQEYFKGLTIGSSYYENNLQYSRYTKWKNLRQLSKKDNKIDTIEHFMDPIEVNAFYIPWKNALIVTAADFQSPFFAYGRPQAINYGIVGSIMAHEVNHGFDNRGHMYDENGDFLGWFSAMADAYDKKEDCFIEQFNNYPIDTKTNGKIKNYGMKTTGDNIADTMGLQAIFKVYQSKETESETPDAALPGMEDFTNDQLFFISYANLECQAINSSKLMEIAENDEHSIGRLRVIGSVSNSDDFATAFNCPIGSPMNPEKKCNIWK